MSGVCAFSSSQLCLVAAMSWFSAGISALAADYWWQSIFDQLAERDEALLQFGPRAGLRDTIAPHRWQEAALGALQHSRQLLQLFLQALGGRNELVKRCREVVPSHQLATSEQRLAAGREQDALQVGAA